MSPKEIAERLRFILRNKLPSGHEVTTDLRDLVNEIDPPKPQRPKPGTVVRIFDSFGIAHREGVAWINPRGYCVSEHWGSEAVRLCKPVHILADDEVAVKRSELLKLANGERLLEESKYDSGEVSNAEK